MKQLGQVMTVFTTIGLSFCVNRAESVTVQDFDAPGTPFTSVQKERPPPPMIMSGGPRESISDPPDSAKQVGISSASGFRFHAGPAADCRSFLLTNAGGYYQMGGTDADAGSRLRGIVDWGMMVNVSQRNALGLSWFVTLDDDELTTGPVARYRRWFGHAASLDIAAGTPLYNSHGSLSAGSILGLIKYNPVNWFGVAVRPEYVRDNYYDQWTETSTRLYAGVEFSGYPGLGVTLGGAGTLVLLGILYAIALSGME